MNALLNALMVIFYLVAIIGLFYSIYFMLSKLYSYAKLRGVEVTIKSVEKENSIEHDLSLLTSNVSPQEQAKAFGRLIKSQYVLVHILQNRGNCYNDKRQSEIYRQSLTKECVNKLFELEGQDGGYLF